MTFIKKSKKCSLREPDPWLEHPSLVKFHNFREEKSPRQPNFFTLIFNKKASLFGILC